jgi:hypothetical protein
MRFDPDQIGITGLLAKQPTDRPRRDRDQVGAGLCLGVVSLHTVQPELAAEEASREAACPVA